MHIRALAMVVLNENIDLTLYIVLRYKKCIYVRLKEFSQILRKKSSDCVINTIVYILHIAMNM